MTTTPIRIGNISGYYGDRREAVLSVIESARCDVVVGDYLAEITMGILARQKRKDPERGFARSFLDQMRDTLRPLTDRGIRVVANAGGVNPRSLADRVAELASELGVRTSIGFVEGDDLEHLLTGDEWRARFPHLDGGAEFDGDREAVLSANAYLGSWGIAAALEKGAQIVICPRVTDAAVAIGPVAWHFGWARNDWDRLAAAAVAGHLLECGPHATGGNFAFYREVAGLEEGLGRPIVEIEPSGDFVVELEPGMGGAVNIDTITAQLLYEVGSVRYLTPDVTVHWDSIQLTQVGENRVRVHGVVGSPPPRTLKAGLSYVAGYRNSMTLGATSPGARDKIDLALRMLRRRVDTTRLDELRVDLLRRLDVDPAVGETTIVEARVTASSREREPVDRGFADAFVGLSLESYPGFFLIAPPGGASPLVGYWPTLVPRGELQERVYLQGETEPFAELAFDDVPEAADAAEDAASELAYEVPVGPSVLAPLGTVVGARSGDKGGDANLGVWARDDAAFDWLAAYLTTDRLRTLLPETAVHRIERHVFPQLRSLNFVIHGILGRGAAACLRPDPQAKGLGEHLRSRTVAIPAGLVPTDAVAPGEVAPRG